MRRKDFVIGTACALAFLCCASGKAEDVRAVYAAMAPLAQYQAGSRAQEIALARSAAPAAISGDAEVQTLGERGYETAVKGKNGFVCMVWRSWAAGFADADFWNP